jgi:hypothetical protein
LGKSTPIFIYATCSRPCFNLQHLPLIAAFFCALRQAKAVVSCTLLPNPSFPPLKATYLTEDLGLQD